MASRPFIAVDHEPVMTAAAATRDVLGTLATAAACGLVYLGALETGAALRFPDGGFAALWPANAVLLSALMLSPARRWWVYVLAVTAAHFAGYADSGLGTLRLAWQIAHNCALCLAGAAFLRAHLTNRHPFETTRDLVAYLIVVVFALPAVAALAAPGTLLSAGADGDVPSWTAWRFTYLANAINFLALVPAIVLWGANGRQWLRNARAARILEAASIGALAVVLCIFAFTGPRSSPAALYTLLVPLLWASARFGAPGVASVHFVMVLLATALVVRGGGSRAMEDVFDLQMFLVLLALPMLILAVLMDERSAAATELRENAEALRATERSLRESNERFQLVLRATSDIIFDWNMTDSTMWWSENGNRLLGRHVENRPYDLRWWSARIHPTERERVMLDLQAAIERRDDIWEVECRFRAEAGPDVYVHARGLITRDPEGRPLRMIGSLMNVTDRKRLDDAHRRLAHAGRLMIAGELTASIAHEINQPLAAILNNAEAGLKLLESYPTLHLAREILEDIRRDDVRASQVISRLRSWLRDRALANEPVDFNEIVRDVVRLLKPEAARRGVRIETELGAIPQILGDQVHLQQVMMNLLVNGMEAMTDTPPPRRRLVVLTAANGDRMVESRVIDAGCGIPAERLPALFDSFYTSKKEGMGVGLSIVRSIVQAHGGRIGAANNADGTGATFKLELPAARG
ncbi:MAG TPA: MASE1 domain-containing protein [Gammaproteobacteria bacterium]